MAGRDGGDFFITQGGTLAFRYPPDYEGPADSNRDNVYELEVRPYDGRYYGSYAVTVTVTDVNEPPEIRRGSTTSFTQAENRTSRLYSYSATDPERGTVSWSVGGTDGNLFTIDERGQFSFKETNPPDFDAPGDVGRDNLYNVTIQARDPESNTASLPVTVTVTEVNEGPVIARQGSAPGSVPENQAQNMVLARYTATDPERPNVKLTQWSPSGRDGGDFVIDALGELRFRNAPDYERPADSNRDNVYEVTIRASDGRYTSTLEEIQTVTVTDVNEAPTITTSSRTAFSQPENRVSTLYTFRATDPEGGTVTWTAAGTDGRFFAIDERGRFSFMETGPPDFDAPGDEGRDNVYDVTVQAGDEAFNTASLDVTVTVTDDSEGVEPTISTRRPPTTYRENGTSRVYTFRASDPQRGAITWSLDGDDEGDFSISETGALTFNSPPDFESPTDADRDNEYELAVVATDAEGHTDSVAFTITVTNDAEGVEPTISARRPPSTYRENGTSTVYTFRASDPQRGAITWSLRGTDDSDFSISETGALTFSSPPDFEIPSDANRDNEYELTVVATDEDNYTDRLAFTITVTDLNEGPVIRLERAATTSVPENYDENQVLADYTATDPEDPGILVASWSTAGRDGGDFVISELGELRFRYSPDHERPADSDRDNVYEVTVRASDGRAYGTLEEPLIVTVTEVNEAPVITTKSSTAFTRRENTTAVLYTYRATDQDADDVIRWSVEGADGEDFAIYAGVLTLGLLPDYELPVDSDRDNEYRITVVAADRAGLRDTVDASITITDQPEGPVIAGRQGFIVTENYDIAQALGSYTATDAKDLRPVYPRWSLSGSDGGDFVIDPATGSLTFRNTPDHDRPADGNRDNRYQVTVRGYDGRAYGNLNVTVMVTDVNEPPAIRTGSRTEFTYSENRTGSIYTYRATDPEQVTITWSVSGVDRSFFSIDSRGRLSFANPLDFEARADRDGNNVYAITVVAEDDGGLRGELNVAVTVTDVNEGPEVTGRTTFTVVENLDWPGASFTATDPEGDAVTRWSLSGSDGGDFNISENGELTFRNTPDYDRPADSNRDNEYLVAIRAYDNRGRYGSYEVTVTVTAANEPPVITGSDARNFPENGTGTIYTYRATDPEGDEFTWIQPAGDDGQLFDISDRGALTFKNPPDFDIAGDANRDNDYQVTVQARDDNFNTGAFDVTVTVTDVNEGPEVSGREIIAVQEYTDPTLDPALQTLATYTARDPEGSDISRWSLSGSDRGDFLISEDGELTFRYAPDYDRPVDSNRDNEYLVSVRAYDATNRYGSLNVTVTVRGVNEADPVVTGSQSLSFRENTAVATRLYTYRATDADRDTIIVWSVRGRAGNNDGNDFDISETGVLTFKEVPDYELPADSDRDNEYLVTVVATDDQGREGREGTLDVTVSVTEAPEGPEITTPSGQTEFSYDENGDRVVATFTARDPEEPTSGITRWSLAGSDGGDFTITDTSQQTGRNTAELTFGNTPDYDSPADSNRDNEYLVTIRAYDQGNRYGSLDVKITVIDENEATPVVTGSRTLSFRENTATTTRLYTYRATDRDRGATITWSVEGDDRDDFAIDAGVLTFNAAPDYEDSADVNDDNDYEITVVASDGTNRGTLDVTIMVTDVNEGPEITGAATRTVAENFEDLVATYSGEDPEDTRADITRWSVTGRDGGDFTINEDGELSFRNPPDFERPADSNRDNEYEVTVRASDGRYYGNYDVTVTVEDVNEAPEFRSGSRTSFSYRENGASALYTYRATDPEQGEIAWSVSGADAADFEISEAGGVLTFREPPDFDDPDDSDADNEYLVTVVARDDQFNSAELAVTVTVTELNEGPEIAETPANTDITVRENSEGALFDYSATDPEDTSAEITLWSVRGTDGGDFIINAEGELTFRNVPDFERPADSNRDNEYLVTVRASDGRYYGTLEVRIKVEAENEAPEFRSGSAATFAYPENGTSDLYTYRATDPEGNDLTWGLSGTDRGAFAISETGVLSFIDPPDYESPTDSRRNNVYEVTVEAGDDDGNTARLEVTVTVTNLTDRLLSITGTAQVGRTLTADTSGIADPDGQAKVSYSYQWIRNGGETDTDIAGATDPTYTPSVSDVGKTVKVQVTFADGQGNEETLTSKSTAAVAATVPAQPLGLTVTRGSRTQELDASWRAPASNGGSAITGYRVQWKEATGNWDTAADVSEATVTGTTYTITGLTGGVEYAVRVIASNDVGAGPASTEASGTPAGGVSGQNTEPENNAPTGLPTISGTVQVDETLTADISGIAYEDGLDDVSYSYQWIAGGSDIDGATGSSYVLTSGEQGQAITVRVSFTDDANNAESLTSAATAAVAAAANRAATGLPTIGGTVQVDQTLTVSTSDIADEDGLTDVSYSYQWMADDTNIQGATNSTYTLADSYVGKAIKVKVSFTDDANNAESLTSAATATVAAGVPGAPGSFSVSVNDTGKLDVSWSAPGSNGGSAVTGYRVQWKEAADRWESPADVSETTVTGSGHTVSGLTDGVEYTFRLYAVNTAGDSPASGEERGTPRETTAPAVSSATVDGATLAITFSEVLIESPVPVTTTFTVNVGQNERAVDAVAISGSTVTLTLASAVTSGDQVTVSYTAPSTPSAARLKDLSENSAASFTAQAVTNNTAAALTPLTASSHSEPASHDGQAAFTFELRFSENLEEFSYRTLRDHAFTVTGGEVAKARRLERGKNVRWEITVSPDGDETVTIVLPITTDCTAQGAICTGDGRMLSNRLEVTVSGPGS